MNPISRRNFFSATAGGLTACLGGSVTSVRPEGGPRARAAVVQVTDLFRPYADPDDHWDLACVYALALAGRIELAGIMIDHPPEDFHRDPDVLAVAQMNRITGLAVPVVVGSSRRISPSEASLPGSGAAAGGARALLSMLRKSRLPVIINVLGSSRDVALAGRLEPGLFAEKCAAVYLNAGSGTADPALAARLEYNVVLDPVSYAAMFDLPCPVYWLPCHEISPDEHEETFKAGPRGTYYKFLQKEILQSLSPRVQNYFAFMFKQGNTEKEYQGQEDALRPDWLRYLEGSGEKPLLARQGEKTRNMWCTAGFFHAAGLSVSADGTVGEAGSAASPVFAFDPVRVRCGENGITEWSANPDSRDRFLFGVRDEERYPGAMTAAMRDLLGGLP
jgi:hypothetical protein